METVVQREMGGYEVWWTNEREGVTKLGVEEVEEPRQTASEVFWDVGREVFGTGAWAALAGLGRDAKGGGDWWVGRRHMG